MQHINIKEIKLWAYYHPCSVEESRTKTNRQNRKRKNFEILKYDGIRARNMRQLPYAIKCFEQAIALNDEPETLQLLANAYIEAGRTDDARITLDRLVDKTPDNIQALLALASICYMQEDYESMDDACQKAIKLDETSAPAYYLAAKGCTRHEK